MKNNLTHKLLLLMAVGIFVFLNACKTEQAATTTSSVTDNNMRNSTPPDHALILGKVVNILENDPQRNNSDVCQGNPCRAEVEVLQVLSYGSSFPPLSMGKVIVIDFVYSLAPQTQPSLDGLQVGSEFEAQVAHAEIMGGGSAYTIYDYTVK